MTKIQNELKISKIARFGAGFIAVMSLTGLAGAIFAMFSDEEHRIEIGVAAVLVGFLIYVASFIALKGIPPRFLSWTTRNLLK